MAKEKDTLTSLQKLTDTGHEANVDEGLVDDVAIPDKKYYLLKMSDNAVSALLDLAVVGVLEYQRDIWERAIMAHQTPPGSPFADVEYQEALYAVQNMEKIDIPVIADTNAHSNADPALLQPQEYYKWITVADIKAQMPFVPAPQLQDSGGNDLPDDYPVLVLPPRKYGAHAWAVFYLDTHINGFDMTGYVTKAKDFVTNHPGFEYILTENGGWIDDTDIVGQLYLEREAFLNSQFVIDFILGFVINQGILNWYNFNLNLIYNPSVPVGGWPPGLVPPDPTIIPPANLDTTSDMVFDCLNTGFDEFHGTNSTGIPSLFGAKLLPAALGLDYLDLQHYNLKPDIEAAAKFRTHVTDATRFEEIEICYKFYYTDSMALQLPFLGTDLVKSDPPVVTVTRTGFQESYEFDLAPEEVYTFPLFKMPLVIPPATLPDAIDVQARIARADDSTKTFDHWQEIDGIYIDGKLLPADYSDSNNPWDNTFLSPLVRFSLKRVRLTAETWRGVGFAGDIDQTCTVVNIAPGFFQDAWGVDLKNATGDTQLLFSGVNWISTIDAILIEVYCPNLNCGMWMPPSGSSSQGVMDAWRAANPNANYDGSNNLIIYSDNFASNQICYTWLAITPGMTTSFAVDITPVPLNCWARIVAFHDSATGKIKVQEAAHKCGSIVYPDYPNYPF